MNAAHKLIEAHLVDGALTPGRDIAVGVDQTLSQDATGGLVMLELEAMGVEQVRTELSAQYVDHNLLQEDYRNPDDHRFLQTACRKHGVWFSRPGNGVSHPVHMERFGVPGKSLLGSDSHTCAAGALGMLAIGVGGLEVALAMAGEPFYTRMPRVMGVRLEGALPEWVSAKDVILEMLRRHGVSGGRGRIIEYYGPGLEQLSAMDRHVIANMGAELGATTSVFPADGEVRRFLAGQGREADFRPLSADEGATYDDHDSIDLAGLVPLIALPGSPGNVVPVEEVEGRPIAQAYIGSSANPGLRDFAVPAMMVEGHAVHQRVSFDINPTSRQMLENLIHQGHLATLIHAGARLHQTGCNGCIGMGQAPATDSISLRTVPRNFPGRSGTPEDQVYLCSPETATASALRGEITDPRRTDRDYPRYREPDSPVLNQAMLQAPAANPELVAVEKGPNIQPLPAFDSLPDRLEGPVLLELGDDVSTDEIMPAGAKVLPFRNNIPEISRFVFRDLDPDYPDRAAQYREGGSFILAGDNYGQGSSREHAALAPRYLGLRAVLARSYSRIHRQNLINFGILPLVIDAGDSERIGQGDRLLLEGLRDGLRRGQALELRNIDRGESCRVSHDLSERQVEAVLAGSLLSLMRERQGGASGKGDAGRGSPG